MWCSDALDDTQTQCVTRDLPWPAGGAIHADDAGLGPSGQLSNTEDEYTILPLQLKHTHTYIYDFSFI